MEFGSLGVCEFGSLGSYGVLVCREILDDGIVALINLCSK
jgi:hypothetical protein